MLSNPNPIDPQIDDKTVNVKELLIDLLDSNLDLGIIAGNHKLTLPQLTSWCKQPAVRQFIADANELANLRAENRAAQARQIAITTLADQCRTLYQTPRDRETANKASRALLRQTGAAYRQAEPSSPTRRSISSITTQNSELSTSPPPAPPAPVLSPPVPRAEEMSRGSASDRDSQLSTQSSAPSTPPPTPHSPSPHSPASPPLRFRVFHFKPAPSPKSAAQNGHTHHTPNPHNSISPLSTQSSVPSTPPSPPTDPRSASP